MSTAACSLNFPFSAQTQRSTESGIPQLHAWYLQYASGLHADILSSARPNVSATSPPHAVQETGKDIAGKGFSVVQPGSSVATALSEGEAKPKHVLILEILNDGWRSIKHPLQTVRPFIYDTVRTAAALHAPYMRQPSWQLMRLIVASVVASTFSFNCQSDCNFKGTYRQGILAFSTSLGISASSRAYCVYTLHGNKVTDGHRLWHVPMAAACTVPLPVCFHKMR